MKTVAFYTLGCKLNFSETSSISRTFEEKGYSKVSFEAGADIVIINTCSVTENADKKCKKVVKDALKLNAKAFIVVIGCYAQLKPKEITEIPGVDAVLGAAEKFQLLSLIERFEKTDKPIIKASAISEANTFHHSHSINDRTRTFLKVQDGCNYNCSFCTIPLARGKSRSDTITNIVQQAQKIASGDVKEIVLTGVNIGDFGIIDGKRKERFIDLIKELDKIEQIDRFRISSIEPNLLSTDIIEFVNNSKRFVPHFHIPLQSGSDELLKTMRRRYETSLYKERVAKIKSLMPHCCIGVDVIVGFPGESDELFLETYNFLNELDISYLHVFTYSERVNTPAPAMANPVPFKIRQERAKMLRILSEKKKRAFYESFTGYEDEVLFENKVENGKIYGFTRNYIRVGIDYNAALQNEIRKVKLGEVGKDGNVLLFDNDAEIISPV